MKMIDLMYNGKKTIEKKFPLRLQRGNNDCGPTCLRMVAEFYGKKYNHHYLCNLSNISSNGVNIQNITDAAETIGFQTMSVRTTFEKLSNHAQLPCIVHLKNNHYTVIYSFDTEKSSQKENYLVYIADPSNGFITLTEKEFRSKWTNAIQDGEEKGIAILLHPNPLQFYQKTYKN